MASWAYIDSSLVIAALFGENLGSYKDVFKPAKKVHLLSSYLLEAEVISAVKREQADQRVAISSLERIGFLRTNSLIPELKQVYNLGYVRGADAFHLATAIWLRDRYTGLSFLTLDQKQAEIAKLLDLSSTIQ